jgi:hypothetical protein
MVMVATLVLIPTFVAMPAAIMMMVMPSVMHSMTLDDDVFGAGDCRISQPKRCGRTSHQR